MAFKLAEAFVQLSSKGFTSVETGIAKIRKSLFELSSASGIAGALSLTGLVIGLRKAITEAEEAEKAQRRLHAAIRLTGGAAGVTAEDINTIAKSLAATSEFDDDAIAKATASMLEFSNISQSVLKRTIPVAVDLAARTGDLEGAFRGLGAALSDPAEHLGLLRRQYRAFSPEVAKAAEELARSGKLVEAQAMILDELAKHTGGLAAAMVTPLDQAKKAMSELAESVGQAMGPVVTDFAKGMKAVADFYAELARGEQAFSLNRPKRYGGTSGSGPFSGNQEQLIGAAPDFVAKEKAEADRRAAKGRERMQKEMSEQERADANARFLADKRAASEKERKKLLEQLEAESLEGPGGERARFMIQLKARLEKLKELYASEIEIEQQRQKALGQFEDQQRSKAFKKVFGPIPGTLAGVAGLAGLAGARGGDTGDFYRSLMQQVAPDSDRSPIRRRLEIEFNAADLQRQVNKMFGPSAQRGERGWEVRRDQLQNLVQQLRGVQQDELTQSTRKAPEFVGIADMARRIQEALGGPDKNLEKRQTDILKRIQDLSQGQGLNVNIRNIDELAGLGAVGI